MSENATKSSFNPSREKSLNDINVSEVNNRSKGSSQVSRRSRDESASKLSMIDNLQFQGRGSSQLQKQQSFTGSSIPPLPLDKNMDKSILQEFQRLRSEIKSMQDENIQIKSMMESRDEKLRRMASLALKQGIALERMKSFVEFKNFEEHESEINTLRFLFERDLDSKALYPEIEANVESENLLQQITQQFEKKLEGIWDMKTKVLQLTTKNENINNKLRGIESQILLITQDMSERIKRQEYIEAIENISVQQKSLNNMLKLLADKESVRGIVSKIQNIEKQANLCVLRTEFDSQLNKQIAEMKDGLELAFENLYLKKQVFYIEMKKQQMTFDDFILLSNDRHNKNVRTEEKVTEKIADIFRKFDQKVDQKAFNTFKEWCTFFVHKDDIDDMYTKILPVVSQVEQKSKQCVESVEQFKQFLKQTDEAILFRATRMDLEILSKDIYTNFTSLNTHKEQIQSIVEQMTQHVLDIKQQIQSNKQLIENNVRDVVHNDIIEDLQTEVQKYFQKLEINKLESTLESIKDSLTKKADVSDLILLNEQKTHKQNTEKIVQFVTMLHKQFKQMNYSCLQFMRTFLASAEIESQNSKQYEMSKSVGQMEQLFTQANGLTFQRYFRQYDHNISPTIKNFNSLKLQDSGNNEHLIYTSTASNNLKDSIIIHNQPPGSTKNGQSFVGFNTQNNYFPNQNNRSTSPFERTFQKNNDEAYSRNQTPQPTSKRYSIGNKFMKVKISNMKPFQSNNKNLLLNEEESCGQVFKINKSLHVESEVTNKIIGSATTSNFYDPRKSRKAQINQVDTLGTLNLSKQRCQTEN